MKSFKTIVLITSFATGFVIAFITVFFKFSQIQNSFALIITGITAMLIFMVISINEVGASTKINKSEKIIWTISLILLCNLAGLLYLIYSRKRIISF